MKCNVCLTREMHCLNRKERNMFFKPESDYTLLLLVRQNSLRASFSTTKVVLRQIEWTWFRVRENFHILFSFRLLSFASSLRIWKENIGLSRSLWLRISCSFELCSSLASVLLFLVLICSFLLSLDSVFLHVLRFCRPFSCLWLLILPLRPWFFLVVYLPPLTFLCLKSLQEEKTAAGDSLYLEHRPIIKWENVRIIAQNEKTVSFFLFLVLALWVSLSLFLCLKRQLTRFQWQYYWE